MSEKNKIYLYSEKDKLNIYMHSSKGKEQNFMKYCLKHLIEPYRDGGTYQNYDLWRLYELYSTTSINGDFKDDFPHDIVNAGEWECALKIDGTPDFHGGLHGYEHQKSVLVKADSKEIELAKIHTLCAEKFEFVQKSEIYLQGTKDKVIAKHEQHYIFKNGRLMLHQKILWEQELTILYSYMAMLPIKRTSDNTSDGDIVTDRVMINNSSKVYDVGKIGHQTGISSSGDHVRDVKYAKIWGEQSGICAELSIKCEFLPTNNFLVQNTPTYNKFYFSYAGDGIGHKVKKSDLWVIDAEYEIYRM